MKRRASPWQPVAKHHYWKPSSKFVEAASSHDDQHQQPEQLLSSDRRQRMEKWFNGSKFWLFGNQLQLLPKR